MFQRLLPVGPLVLALAVAIIFPGGPALTQESSAAPEAAIGSPGDAPPYWAVIWAAEWADQPPTPAPPGGLTLSDEGSMINCVVDLSWTASADDGGGLNHVTGYRIRRGPSPEGPFEEIETVLLGMTTFRDTNCEFDTLVEYRVTALTGEIESEYVASEISPYQPWIDRGKANVFIIGLIIAASIIYFISHAKAGKKLFIRKIAGLEAVDEAIGRATEMGRPILFIPGILDMNDVQTVSAVIILGRIAKTIAEYDTKLYCPTSKSLVMTTARETVKEAYLSAGRPDAYNDDMITYLTDEQFGYVAGVNGIMVREKPATCFYLGAFFAESLILAETGNSIGAIQVAGTAMPSQLPFFIAACDYTLIGEELFAASAYLSHEPRQLGSLKGQDVGKAIALFSITVGGLLATLHAVTGIEVFRFLSEGFQNWFAIQP